MLASSLLKKGVVPISNDNLGLSSRPSDMEEQVSGGEKHPKGQTWAGSRVILEAVKGHGGGVGLRGWHCAPRSHARAGHRRAGSGQVGAGPSCSATGHP